MTRSTGALSMISAPYACAARASTWVNPPLPPLWNDQAPKCPSCSPERVVEQHQPGALGHRSDLGAGDPRGGDVALEDVALEVVVEEVGGAAGEQPDQVVDHLLVDAAEVLQQLGDVLRSSGDLPKMFGGTLSSSGLTTWQTRSTSCS